MRNVYHRSVFFIICTLLLGSCGEKISPEWDTWEINTEDRLTSVEFTDRQTGFVAGGRRFDLTVIFRTDDNGNSWERQLPENQFDKLVFDLEFRNESEGFAACYEGKVLRTEDGGATWQLSQTEHWMPMKGLFIVNDSVLVAVGGDGYDRGSIHRSEDNGRNWRVIDSMNYELRDVVFTDEKTGYACGYGTVIKTTDGGLNWTLTPAKNEFFSTLDFPTASTGYVAGRTGTIIKTTDAGNTWKVLRNGNNPFNPRHAFHRIRFLNENTGYLVGDNGLIMKTADGGKTWNKLDKGTREHLHDIFLFDEGDGIIVGEKGTILRFSE